MQIYRVLLMIFTVLLATGCSKVRVAVYDQQKRQVYARETRNAFSNSEAGKEMALKNSIITTAEQFLGTRYKYGSTDPRQGFDCSGLVYHVAKKHQIELPRSSSTLAAAAPHIPWKKARPGDLVFFGDRGRINHVGIVKKNSSNELWIIHSTTQRGVLHENVLSSSYWKKRLLFAVDFTSLYTSRTRSKS